MPKSDIEVESIQTIPSFQAILAEYLSMVKYYKHFLKYNVVHKEVKTSIKHSYHLPF
jgi:hypothetical protein